MPSPTRSIRSIIRLNAGNDTNGNPRRVYVGMDRNSCIVKVWDDGYQNPFGVGERSKEDQRLWRLASYGPTFATTPAEYRFLLRNFNSDKE